MSEIAEIRLHRLEVPLRTPYKLAFGLVRHFDTLIAEVTDSRGRVGLGEATVLTGYTDETPQGSWKLMQRLARESTGTGVEDARSKLLAGIEGAPFTVTALVTALEMLEGAPALSLAAPVQVPLLGLVNAESPAELEAEIDALLERGFRTLKVKVGFDAEADARRLRLIQRTVRGRAAIRVDANQGFGLEDAKRFAAGMDPEGIELFEQPCRAGDWDAASAVAAVSTVPMMLDESIFGIEDIERAAELRAARFIKLKLMKLGSLERLAAAIEHIRALGMEPVLGNGVACEIGCWMEAMVAHTHIRNAGEMNGYLKQAEPLLVHPPAFSGGAIRLEPGYRPELDRAALRRVARDCAEFRSSSALARA
ncbi:MAG TPA: enolase C-terminal domain-like protein [Burkholderiales bacterium]|nr:enolase C-terminal domain-like protein [Burkholderiales bacterium]